MLSYHKLLEEIIQMAFNQRSFRKDMAKAVNVRPVRKYSKK